jgi:hypothetical protein
LVVVAVLVHRAWDPRRRLLGPIHIEELRAAARRMPGRSGAVVSTITRLGATLAASPGDAPGTWRVSLSLGVGRRVEAEVLCRLASAALPGVRPDSGLLVGEVLHVLVDSAYVDPAPLAPTVTDRTAVAEALYGHVLRRLQDPAAYSVRAVGGGR